MLAFLIVRATLTFSVENACYAKVAAYNTHPLVAIPACNLLFKNSSKPFVWAPESSE
jgi:hypothetical protein